MVDEHQISDMASCPWPVVSKSAMRLKAHGLADIVFAFIRAFTDQGSLVSSSLNYSCKFNRRHLHDLSRPGL